MNKQTKHNDKHYNNYQKTTKTLQTPTTQQQNHNKKYTRQNTNKKHNILKTKATLKTTLKNKNNTQNYTE